MTKKLMETWIPVDASEGAFTSEYAISVKCSDGSQVTLFADKSQVRKDDEGAYLRVTLVNSDPGHHRQTILLPTEAFETSSRWVDIHTK